MGTKYPNFEKYPKYFLRLGHWPASESQKISVWACDWGMQLDQPVTKSPEQGNTVFEDFDNFLQKQNTFQKQLKTHKKNYDWSTKIEHVKNTFNQIQSHEWIWHSLNIDMCVMCGYQK